MKDLSNGQWRTAQAYIYLLAIKTTISYSSRLLLLIELQRARSLNMSPFLHSIIASLSWLFLTFCVTEAAAVTRLATRLDLAPILAKRSGNWSTLTTLSFPGSASYTNATERWTTFSAPTYSAAISPATEEDVASVVRSYKAISSTTNN